MAASNKGTPPPPHAAAAAAAAASMYPSLMMYDARSSNISASASSHSTPDSIPSGTVATSTSAMRGTTLVPIPLETMSSSPFTFHTTATTAASSATGYSFAPPDMTTSTTGIIPTTTTATGSTTTTLHRRQKRLERNRESAKLSRRRRKQYLEVLEHKVTQLSLEMDLGRRDHVKNAVNTLKSKRHDALTLGGTNAQVLSRASTELRVAATFQMQQQFSLALPLHSKFLLWLTLQNEPFFKSGRATSERLSAARIGERMLTGGTDSVPPSHGMWPLLCNEVGLSYDQEEKVRVFQKTLLSTPESWVHCRHAAAATSRFLRNTHDCCQIMNVVIETKETNALAILNEHQRKAFLTWAAKNAEAIAKKTRTRPKQTMSDNTPIDSSQHNAANLYILAHRLQHVLDTLPTPSILVIPSKMKRLARRPSFESLGITEGGGKFNDDGRDDHHQNHYSSSGSLKRTMSDISCDDDDNGYGEPSSSSRGERISIVMTSEEAQTAAQPTVDAILGHVRHMIPPRLTIMTNGTTGSPTTAAAATTTTTAIYTPPIMPLPISLSMPLQLSQSLPIIPSYPLPQPSSHNLNVVPEDFPDFLFDLTEEDWAIGEGLDMDYPQS